jgi:hypothetical protein
MSCLGVSLNAAVACEVLRIFAAIGCARTAPRQTPTPAAHKTRAHIDTKLYDASI